MFIKYSTVSLLLALCGGYLAVSKLEDRQCEQDWEYYKGNCYLYARKLTTWRKSQQGCVSKEANLVTVNDQYEQNFINTLLKTKGAWCGLHNNSVRNEFEWISGEKSNFRYWYTGEPLITKSRRCVHMYQKRNHTWHMVGCGNKQRYLCEKAWKPCDSKPCENGGTCVPNGDNYTCVCMSEFTGHQCEQGIKATSTAVNVVISTSRPVEALSTTKAATSTLGIPEVPQSSTVFPAQPHSALISPSTSTEPGTSSSLEGPKVVSFYTKPEMTTAYTEPEMTTSPPKTDPNPTSGEDAKAGARKQPQGEGVNVAAIVVPVVLILLLILLVIIGCLCYGRKKQQKEKPNETVTTSSGELAFLQPQNGVNHSPTEKLPSHQSEGSLQKSLASDEDSIINYSEGGSFMGEYGDGKKAAPDVKFI